MFFYIETLGCKMNSYESEAIADSLIRDGHLQVEDPSRSEVIIINTCTVTQKADSKSRYTIRNLIRKSQNSFIILTGCLIDTDLDVIKNEFSSIDYFVFNRDKDKIANILNNLNNDITGIVYNGENDGSFNFNFTDYSKYARATLKIQDGCNNFCSYCKVPYARGSVRSKPSDDIITECSNLISIGFKEIVFSGINVFTYLYEGLSLVELVKKIIQEFPGLRIRFSSLEPQSIDDEFLDLIRNNQVCPHFHLSLQSGSDTVLKLMNRKYDRDQYSEIISKIRSIKNNPFISTDLIVGFPGETDSAFSETIEFIDRIGFSSIHCFGYSPRKNTPAYSFPDKVPSHIKEKRLTEVKKVALVNNQNYIRQNIQTEHDFLIEKIIDDQTVIGRSENYLSVVLKTNKPILRRDIYRGVITSYDKTINGQIL